MNNTPAPGTASLPFGVEIPFIDLLGIQMNWFEGGESEIAFTPKREHMNSFEVAHGGVIMTLLDIGMATAARSIDKSEGVVTIEMKTSFMQPAKGALITRGKLLHRTRSTAFVEARVLNAEGLVCAHATGTFRYVPRRPGSDQPAQPAPIATD
jgi:uncharacterized protein (TIGR00369 family)